MKISIFLSNMTALLFVACSFSNQTKDCNQFREGNYIYRFRGQSYQTEFSISRTDSVQIERDKKTGKTSQLAIKWTGDCTYELTLLETTFDFPDSIQKLRKSFPTKTEILGWTPAYYLFRSTRDNSDFTLTDTLWIDK